jgi:hypothetical protein
LGQYIFNATLKEKEELNNTRKPDMVAHICNPSYAKGRDGKIMAQDQQGQNITEILSPKTR